VREAALRAEHAAEVARLTVALRSMRAAHAAEIELLRAEHAAGLRQSVAASRALLQIMAGGNRASAIRAVTAPPPSVRAGSGSIAGGGS